jgi:hypothetical protein
MLIRLENMGKNNFEVLLKAASVKISIFGLLAHFFPNIYVDDVAEYVVRVTKRFAEDISLSELY